MTDRILFVDDEPNVLSGFTRLLRREFSFDTALGGAEGLSLMQDQQYAVVVSDMRMPEMGGEEFLAKAHVEQPDAVQMILSGQANLESTVAAVNNGNIFRFLVKPVEKETLTANLSKALHQYRMVNAERELLENTLSGAVGALTEVLSMVSPVANRRTTHVVDVVRHVSKHIGLGSDWQLRLAAMLSGVGFAAMPADVVAKVTLGQPLTDLERSMAARYPDVTAQLLGRIPRLEAVSGIICAQAGVQQAPPGLEQHVLLLDLAVRVSEGLARQRSVAEIIADAQQQSIYGPQMLSALETLPGAEGVVVESIPLGDLRVDMTLREDVTTTSGVMLASSGTVITSSLLERIQNFSASVGVVDPILVAKPGVSATPVN
jgi:FixJ family two-component response regulator